MAPDKQFTRRLEYLEDGAYAGMEKIVSQEHTCVQKAKARKEAEA